MSRRQLHRNLATGAGVSVGATLLMGGAAQAACTCVVDSLADPTEGGKTTLRDAIISANSNSGSTITFASGLSGTITLNGIQLPTITNPTTISGPGASQLTVSGNDLSRIFETNNTVTISGLTIANGHIAGSGGGIRSDGGALTIENSVVTGNDAVGGGTHGGGIHVQDGTLLVTGSTISGNTSGVRGGGIDTAQFTAEATTIVSSTISGNHAGGDGGGAYLAYQSAATVSNSTIYDNTAESYGGGFYHYGRPGAPAQGLLVTGSTISHNTATSRGGGVASYGGSGNTEPAFQDTIVSGNTSPDGADLSARTGAMDAAFSLIGGVDTDSTINETVSGSNILGQDPQLGPLASNGGTTQTQKPATTSPVLDKGAAFGLTGDQRGLSRPFAVPSLPDSSAAGADGSDIGAVELQESDFLPAPPGSSPTTPTTTSTGGKKKCKKRKRSAASAKKKCKKRRK